MANDGWRRVFLEDVADELTVGFVGPMASEYTQDGVPFLRSLNVEPLRIVLKDIKYISETFHKKIQKSALSPGDVVIVRTGRPGSSAVIPEWLPISNCSDLVVIRPGPKLDSRFLCYFINTVATHHISAHLVGAVQQHFNVGSARKILIHLPELAEQKRIAHILGTLDDKIELNRRMNETLEGMARALFKSWFVDFDPVRAKANGQKPPGLDAPTAALFPDSFENSPLGLIPKGWKAIPLYSTAKFVNGAAFKTSDFCDPKDGLPVIKIAELKNGITDQTKYSQKDSGADRQIETEDVLYSWSGSPDTSLEVFRWSNGKGLLNQHIFKVITDSSAQKVFVFYLLRELRNELVEIARNKQTTGLGHVTVADMKRLHIVFPFETILNAFHSIVGRYYDLTFQNEMENMTLTDLRDSLLPKLLSGEFRVTDGAAIED